MKYLKTLKRWIAGMLLLAMMVTLFGCGGPAEAQVVIYSNADEEAKNAMTKVLDENGYEGKYIFQSFGTSELGGKLLAEGTDIEADLVTISSYYLDSVQTEKNMFQTLTFDYTPLGEKKDYYAPVVAPEGAILLNTQVLEEQQLPVPTSLKDLANPIYKDKISMVDIMGSSTAWLMVQAILSEYGEEEGKAILKQIYANAGVHMETSGSGPLKKVRAGEVAIGFGLRHQAVADKAAGLPVDYVDPVEGNYSLTEGIALVDKGDKTNPLAMEMAQCIIDNVRPEIQKTYPVALYEGETVTGEQKSAYPKTYPEALTVELLRAHQEISEECK